VEYANVGHFKFAHVAIERFVTNKKARGKNMFEKSCSMRIKLNVCAR